MSAPGRKKLRIGELLIAKGLITEAQLETALAEQKKGGRKLGRTMIELGFVEEDELLSLLSQQLHLRLIDLKTFRADPDVVRKLSESHARRFRALVLEDRGRDLLVGMSDPLDMAATDELARILRRRLQFAVVRESDLLSLIDRVYTRAEEISTLAVELDDDLGETAFDLAHLGDDETQEETPVVRLLQSLFEDAVRANASDIHIEPDESVLRIRQRVDGVLHEHVVPEQRIASALVLRLKLMASLDISERRRPQDGRFNAKLEDRSIEVRLSTMPVQHGESVVMRLLDHSDGITRLDDLGMPADVLGRFRQLIHKPHGLILVTGPTGSGKSTTLYGALSELNSAEKKIITAEDPVEARVERVSQVQVNTKIDLTFASVLRAALRQDPDILMVGEMRDRETVEIALRAALTGHLVLSTLHTNDAIQSGMRLADMGVEGYLAATALRAVIAQRLVRRVCADCSEPSTPDAAERALLEAVRPGAFESAKFVRGTGCDHCNETGYKGRIGVYELLELDAPTADALRREDTAAYGAAARATRGFRTLVDCALDYAERGATTLEEVFRVAGELETLA